MVATESLSMEGTLSANLTALQVYHDITLTDYE